MFLRVSTLIIVAVVLGVAPTRAQVRLQFPIEPPAQVLRDALDHPYGRALMAEFAKTVLRSADAVCLQSKGLDEAKLVERGREIFQRWGTTSMETIISNVDKSRYEARFAQLAGRNASTELMRLREDPDVKQYLSLERPLRLIKVLGFVIENFDRYVLLNRINMRSFSPLSTGNDTLLRADPTEASEEAMEKFVNGNKSQRFKRFYELSEIAGEALNDAINHEFALRWGPGTFFRGVENDLAELCITKR